MRSISDTRPETLLNLNNGSFQYNTNVEEKQVELENGKKKTIFEYESVVIFGEPTRSKAIKAVIIDRRDETEEFNLINRYNAFTLEISDNVEDKIAYEDYLREVAAVKATVNADFEALGL